MENVINLYENSLSSDIRREKIMDIYNKIIFKEFKEFNNLITSDCYTESVGDELKEKIINICGSIKKYTKTLIGYIKSSVEPVFQKAKSTYNGAVKKTEVKDEWSLFHRTVCKVLHSILKSIGDYGKKIIESDGVYNKLKYLAIAVSYPIPIPGTTTGVILATKFIDIIIDVSRKISNEGIESIIDELKRSIEKVKTIDPETASVGQKLLNKLMRLLQLSQSKLKKAVSTLNTFI